MFVPVSDHHTSRWTACHIIWSTHILVLAPHVNELSVSRENAHTVVAGIGDKKVVGLMQGQAFWMAKLTRSGPRFACAEWCDVVAVRRARFDAVSMKIGHCHGNVA